MAIDPLDKTILPVPSANKKHEDHWFAGSVVNAATCKAEEYPALKISKDSKLVTSCPATNQKKMIPTASESPSGGNKLVFNGPASTPTAKLATVKLLLNSGISTKGARFSSFDIKDFYLNTPLWPY